MHLGRSAAVVLLPFLSFVPLALAQTSDPSKTFFGDVCKAGYSYTLSSTATGFSVTEVQKVDCKKKDANGQLVNANVPECRDKTGDIAYNCVASKCDHKICKEGEPTSVSALAPLTSQSIRAAVNEAPANMGQDSIVRPWTPGSASNLDKLLQAGYAPGGLVPNTGGGQNGGSAPQGQSAYDSLMLYGGSLQEYGGSSAKTGEASVPIGSSRASEVMPQVPGASDAYTLQGGTFAESPATQVQTSRETGGLSGQNTFEPSLNSDAIAQATPAPCTSGVWTCWATQTWANLTSGKIFSSAAEAGTPDSRISQTQPNITTLSVTQNNPTDAPAGLFSTQPLESAQQSGPLASIGAKSAWSIAPDWEDNAQTGVPLPLEARQPPAANVVQPAVSPAFVQPAPQEAPVQNQAWPVGGGASDIPTNTSRADMDTMTPAQLRAVQDQMSADRSAQAQAEADAAKPKITTQQATYAKANAVFGAAFEVLGGGSTDKLKTAWKDYVTTIDNNSRAAPVAPVQMAELQPIPGTEVRTPSGAERALSISPSDPDAPTLAAGNPTPESFNAAESQRKRDLAENVIAQKWQEIEAARTDLQSRTDTYIASTRALGYDDVTQGAAWPTYEQWWKEYEERVDAFTAKVDAYHSGDSDVVQQVDAAARIPAGGPSEGLTRTIDAMRRNSDEIWNQTPSFWDDPVSATLGGATRFAEQTITSSLEASRNLLEHTGQLGETLGFSNPERAVGRVFDPVGATDQLAKDAALVAGTTVAPWGAGRVAGLFERSAWTALPRSVTSDVRLVMEDSAGFSATVARGATETAGSGAAESGAGTLGGVTRTGEITVTRSSGDVVAEPAASGALSSASTDAAAIARTEAAANEIRALSGKQPVTPVSGSNPYAAFDNAVADARAGAAQSETAPAVSSAVEAPAAVAPAAEKAVESGSLANVSAGPKALEPTVENLTMRDWVGGTGATAGIACLGFCPLSEPPPRETALQADVLGLSREDIAILFPQSDIGKEEAAKKSELPPPAEVTIPAGIVTEQELTALFTKEKPAEELPPPSVTSPAAAVPPPAVSEEDVATPSPAQAPTAPLLTPESSEPIPDPLPPPDMRRQLAAEEAEKVMAEVERVRAQNLASDRAEQESRAQRLAEMQEQIKQQQAALDAQIAAQQAADAARKKAEEEAVQLAQPVMTPAPVVGTGTGPTADVIAAGLSGNATVSGGENSSPRVSIPIQFVDNTAFPTPEGNVTINSLGEAASKEKFKGYSFTIEGYTDPRTPSATWGRDNVRLSQARAEAVRQTIATFYNIPLSSITAIGMGAANPVMNSSGVIDNAASRRVVVTAIPPKR